MTLAIGPDGVIQERRSEESDPFVALLHEGSWRIGVE